MKTIVSQTASRQPSGRDAHFASRILTNIVVCLFFLWSGCNGATQLMPTPTIYTHGDTDPFAGVPKQLQSNRVDVIYLTDRLSEEPNSAGMRYGFKRSRSVAFGIAQVQFGEDDVTWEQLVAASRTARRKIGLPVRVVQTTEMLRYPESPRILMELQPLLPASTQPTTSAAEVRAELEESARRATAELSARLALTPEKEVYVFVHGYANSFDDSVMTIAQLWHFLGRRGVPIAYSWPAGRGGLLRGYTYDRESSEFTVYHLKEMIRAIAKCPDVKKINIIAHSRGTGVLISSLCELHLEIGGSGRSTRDVLKLGTIVLAAPDVDLDVMIQRAVTVRLGLVPERSAMYICGQDKALGIANWLFGGMSRLGGVRAQMFRPDEIKMIRASKTLEIIDARVSNTGAFGHDYFHSNPSVSSDLILLLRYQLRPGAENGRPLKMDDSGFWVIDDKYPGNVACPTTQASAH